MRKGKFIVIDGIDGSGKTTQTNLLLNQLVKNGYKIKTIDFPRYNNATTVFVKKYLNGKYGSADEVGPYRGSIFYACDRYDASFEIKKWLDKGYMVVSNRYVTANMGHQGGKIISSKERKEYFKWLYDLEYDIFGIPKPDLNIILHVDAVLTQKMVSEKGKRAYIKIGQKDIHENDIIHLKNAEKIYKEIAGIFPNFKLVECMNRFKIRSREDISEEIWKKVKKII